MNIIDLVSWKFTETQSRRGIAQLCKEECTLLYKWCEVQTAMSDIPIGRLCYCKVPEGGVSRNYFDNIKDVKDYVLGSFLLQGPNYFYCAWDKKQPWSHFLEEFL